VAATTIACRFLSDRPHAPPGPLPYQSENTPSTCVRFGLDALRAEAPLVASFFV